MFIIEFRKEAHEENVSLAHRIKNDLCELIEHLESGSHGERRVEHDFMDEHDVIDERRGRGGRGRYGMRDDRYEDRHYPEYPYMDRRGGGRYGY